MRLGAWSWAVLVLVLLGCGEGDLISLGRTSAAELDGGPLDGSVALGDGARLLDGGLVARPSCRAIPIARPITCTNHTDLSDSEPRIKWRFPPGSSNLPATVTPGLPLVANLTDDNGDGVVDVCDVPDVLLMAADTDGTGVLWLLAGDTGEVEALLPASLRAATVPAIADLDGDGISEIVAEALDGGLLALSAAGEQLWRSEPLSRGSAADAGCQALAIYDLDGDGAPEILGGSQVFDSYGQLRFDTAGFGGDAGGKLGGFVSEFYGLGTDAGSFDAQLVALCQAPTAADLDDDGVPEALFGNVSVRGDGTPVWGHRDGARVAELQVLNLDEDPGPELVATGSLPLRVLDADGSDKSGFFGTSTQRSAVWLDADGDTQLELALAQREEPWWQLEGTSYQPLATAPRLPRNVSSLSAFDFAGAGRAQLLAQAIADGSSTTGGVYDLSSDSRSMELPNLPGGARANSSYPVVADVDNDGSADILAITSSGLGTSLVVYEESQKRWVGTRRIWNQFAYHVTNIEEDGKVPRRMIPSFQTFNTFRSNAQQENGVTCVPAP